MMNIMENIDEYAVSWSNYRLFPVSPVMMEVRKDGSAILDLTEHFVDCRWGNIEEEFDVNPGKLDVFPDSLFLAYTGILEKSTYVVDEKLCGIEQRWNSYPDENGISVFSRILIGIAPYGYVACWLWGKKKSVIMLWSKAKETIKDTTGFCDAYMDAYMDTYMAVCAALKLSDEVIENALHNGSSVMGLHESYMKQYRYRYSVYFEEWSEDAESDHWNKYDENQVAGMDYPELDYMDEALCDGTHDKLHDGGLMKYHDAGKPDKIAVRWHIAKSEYDAYFWFDRSKMSDIYDKFYGAHRDVQSDFIFRIDVRKKKYELSMFRYGLRQPVLIPEEAYQILVFKNKFENFRSENYAQRKGAWIW